MSMPHTNIHLGFDDGSEDLGPAYPFTCVKCEKDVFLHLVRSKVTLSIMFVPVSNSDTMHHLVCPLCLNGVSMKGDDLAKAKAAQQFLQEAMKQNRPLNEVLEELSTISIEALVALKKTVTEWRCVKCGNDVPESFDCCWKCGADRDGSPEKHDENA